MSGKNHFDVRAVTDGADDEGDVFMRVVAGSTNPAAPKIRQVEILGCLVWAHTDTPNGPRAAWT